MRRTLDRQMMYGAVVLVISAHVQPLDAQTKMARTSVLPPGTTVVVDSVIRNGSRTTAGWREYAADGAWRRIYYVRDGATVTVTFGDGKPGQRLPSVARYVYAGSGPSGGTVLHDEARVFASAEPTTIAGARRSSPVPEVLATRLRGIGEDVRLLQRIADLGNRLTDVGRAFDAAQAGIPSLNPADGLPGRRGAKGAGTWADPRAGIGRDGRASEGPMTPGGKDQSVVMTEGTTNAGDKVTMVVTVHSDGSSTRTTASQGPTSAGTSTENRDATGRATGGSWAVADGSGVASRGSYEANAGRWTVTITTWTPSGKTSTRSDVPVLTPSETGTGRGYEGELSRFLPWLATANYQQWKRETDLVISGGRITQPSGVPSLVLNEGPEVGVSGVVNCGDANTNPCNRVGGVTVDPRRPFGTLSQPGRGTGATPIGGKDVPKPVPSPRPRP